VKHQIFTDVRPIKKTLVLASAIFKNCINQSVYDITVYSPSPSDHLIICFKFNRSCIAAPKPDIQYLIQSFIRKKDDINIMMDGWCNPKPMRLMLTTVSKAERCSLWVLTKENGKESSDG